MGRENSKGGRRGARTGAIVHGELDQISSHVVVVKFHNSQVSSIGSRSEINPYSLDGPTQVPVCQHMRGSLRQMVGV